MSFLKLPEQNSVNCRLYLSILFMKAPTLIQAQDFIVIDAPGIGPGGNSDQISTHHLALDSRLGYFRVKTVFHPVFSLQHAEGSFSYDTLMQQPELPKKKQIGIALMSAGHVIVTFGDQHQVNGGPGVGCLNHNPGMNEYYRLFPGKALETTYFDIDPDYFTELLFSLHPGSCHPIGDVKDKIGNNLFAHIPMAVTPACHRIVSDIVNCPLQGSLRNLMLEGSLQQMIALQLHAMDEGKIPESTVSTRDREVMHAVKEYLDATFMQEHSLLGLSRQFGINQNKLKKSFKALFRVPVIEYVYNLKMEHARNLLYEKRMYVAEVAPIVGYKNPNHFASAFKRKFGISPSRMRGK